LQDLFKPQIERSPLNARNVDNLPIHEHLNEQHKKREERHKNKVTEKERLEEEKRNFKVKSERTQNLLRRMKKSSCEELFRVLLATIDFRKNQEAMSASLSPKKAAVDVNESFAELVSTLRAHEVEMVEEKRDGGGGEHNSTNWKEKTLLPSSCDPTLLDDKVANLITPLLERHKSYPMSLEYFTSLVMLELERVGVESLDIVRTLRNRARQNRARAVELLKESPTNSPEKDKVKKGGKNRFKKAATIIKLFHPSINKKSSQLVMNRSRARAGGDLLFTQLHSAQKHIDQRLLQARKQKEREEDEHCTFKPKLVSKQSKGRYRAREEGS
jgi:hypothetical protein